MAIQRWDPLRELVDVQQRINRLFEDVFERSTSGDSVEASGGQTWKPATDLIEDTDGYRLRADLPGVTAKEIEIRIENGTLILRGVRGKTTVEDGESYLRVERPTGRFEVRVSLAPSVDARAVRATHRNGVIEVSLPKKQAEAPNRVEITAG